MLQHCQGRIELSVVPPPDRITGRSSLFARNGGGRASLLMRSALSEAAPGSFSTPVYEESFQSPAFPPCHEQIRLLAPIIALSGKSSRGDILPFLFSLTNILCKINLIVNSKDS